MNSNEVLHSNLISNDIIVIDKYYIYFYVILDKPICGNLHRKVQGVAQGKSTDIICPVLAHPPPNSFIWRFNNSIEALEVFLSKNVII